MVSPRTEPGMIVTRTPLRVSFAGGGTDLAEFYEQEYGAVLSMAIANYIYVTVKPHSPLFNEPIRLNYSHSEEVERIDEIENDIARECLRYLEIEPPIYISTIGDHPASTGLGSSSAFAVGLLNALHALRGERVTSSQLAEEASHIEIDVLGEPIGKQDQYAAAFGGLNLFRFNPGGGVTVEHQRLANGQVHVLFEHMLMFWSGHQRDANAILSEQNANTQHNLDHLRRMRDQAEELQEMLTSRPLDLQAFGRVLNEGWELKRGLASTITTTEIDDWYERALAAGAYGGKLCGAGRGGFLLLLAGPERHDAVRRALAPLTELRVHYESRGSDLVMPFHA
jgi:D-glycero-alpha-D-manno-heptose-7-phosphate kinase